MFKAERETAQNPSLASWHCFEITTSYAPYIYVVLSTTFTEEF